MCHEKISYHFSQLILIILFIRAKRKAISLLYRVKMYCFSSMFMKLHNLNLPKLNVLLYQGFFRFLEVKKNVATKNIRTKLNPKMEE